MTINYLGSGVYECYSSVGLVLLNDKDLSEIISYFTHSPQPNVETLENDRILEHNKILSEELETATERLNELKDSVRNLVIDMEMK